jgi:hypothetical protein
VEAAEGPRAPILGKGSGRQTGISTPTTAMMTVSVGSCHPIISGGARALRSGVTPREKRLAVKGSKAPVGKEEYGLKMPQRPIKVRGFIGWPANGFTTAPRHRQSEGRGWMGPLAASTRAHKRHGHSDPRPSLD